MKNCLSAEIGSTSSGRWDSSALSGFLCFSLLFIRSLHKLVGELCKKMFTKWPQYGIVESCGGRESGYGEALRPIYDS